MASSLEALDKNRGDIVIKHVDVGQSKQTPVTKQHDAMATPYFIVYSPDGSIQSRGSEAYRWIEKQLEEDVQ